MVIMGGPLSSDDTGGLSFEYIQDVPDIVTK